MEEFHEKVWEKVAEYLDFQSLLTLRKVSHNLRNLIDDSKTVDALLNLVSITINPEDNLIWFKTTGEPEKIEYKKHENGCQILFRQTQKVLKNENFLTRFFQDLEQLFALQKSKLPYLEVNCRGVPQALENNLKSRESPIQVTKILINTTCQHEVMKVLQYTCPETLEAIEIYDITQSNEVWKFGNIMALKHWKNAKKFANLGFHIDAKVVDFVHFPMANFHIKEISTDELVMVKEKFHNAPGFSYFYIYYQKFSDPERLPEFFGEPFIREGYEHDKGRWYFNLKDNNKECFYFQHFGQQAWFSLLDRESVPRGAKIQ